MLLNLNTKTLALTFQRKILYFQSFFFRILNNVRFGDQFVELPVFTPDKTDSGTPLPKSPRAIVKSFKKKKANLDIGMCQFKGPVEKFTCIMIFYVSYNNDKGILC